MKTLDQNIQEKNDAVLRRLMHKEPSKLTKAQSFTKTVRIDATHKLVVEIRYDDQCGNGHNTFSVTGTVYRKSGTRWIFDQGGCIHDVIAEHCPELKPYLKWHLCSSDGPMHYLANTLYHASDRDHNGLRKGETRQVKNSKTGLPCWHLVAIDEEGNEHPLYALKNKEIDAEECPTTPYRLEYRPRCRVGEGKEIDLEAARSTAIWPEATLEQLQSREALEARLPQLLADFRTAMESLGFIY